MIGHIFLVFLFARLGTNITHNSSAFVDDDMAVEFCSRFGSMAYVSLRRHNATSKANEQEEKNVFIFGYIYFFLAWLFILIVPVWHFSHSKYAIGWTVTHSVCSVRAPTCTHTHTTIAIVGGNEINLYSIHHAEQRAEPAIYRGRSMCIGEIWGREYDERYRCIDATHCQ